jgi:hypothetical protein
VVYDGLRPGEKVVVKGLQRARAGAEVTPKVVEMESQVARARTAEGDALQPPSASLPAARPLATAQPTGRTEARP